MSLVSMRFRKSKASVPWMVMVARFGRSMRAADLRMAAYSDSISPNEATMRTGFWLVGDGGGPYWVKSASACSWRLFRGDGVVMVLSVWWNWF